MNANFIDFIDQNPNCTKFLGDREMLKTFEFLSEDSNIITMIDASEEGTPALLPLAAGVEQIFADAGRKDMLEIDFSKQSIGKMVKTILEPFGYLVNKKITFPENTDAKQFKSASTYTFEPKANRSMEVVKIVRAID